MSPTSRCTDGALSLNSRCVGVGALSPTARCIGSALSLPGRCTSGVLRAKNEASRPFSKVDDVELYPYHLGVVAFKS